ncbi:MAG: Asp23/Gls24 family envelope stress response protein [Firmicutes bacterium]|nr:Asp23/Gls24 family envelope stress response protein [Bacillota bacterium]
MATRTTNLYGKITVTNRAIRAVANAALRECYGVAGGRVSFIDVEENKIRMVIRLILKYGVTPEAICESVRSQIRYNVENFAGASVVELNTFVVGIK